ncbi:hypothetical protein QRX50_34485 [Amycolatopsis carbonis]|uniref:Uncharacterized protein n=1 Tax=Amycolatopsis carbonis TaxID=715471 RepID=A0A9Y2ICG4_9PSEU|nr:hypothetical protein [Amycolatopsis sp. 2-15]WIX76545.1 hypothetical protein QRX50_34485 [Amycolatopsis sp. 2-15]
MTGTIGSRAGLRVVVTGVLEVRAAQDGRLDLAVALDGSGDCVALEFPSDPTALTRAAILRPVIASGRLRESEGRWILHVEWLRPARLVSG